MTDTLTHYIAGERVKADTPHESLNPSDTREVVARFPDGGKAEVDAAVVAATPARQRRISRGPGRGAARHGAAGEIAALDASSGASRTVGGRQHAP